MIGLGKVGLLVGLWTLKAYHIPRISNMCMSMSSSRFSILPKGRLQTELMIKHYEEMRRAVIKLRPEYSNKYMPLEEVIPANKAMMLKIKAAEKRIEADKKPLNERIEALNIDKKTAKFILYIQDLNLIFDLEDKKKGKNFDMEEEGDGKKFSHAARIAFAELRKGQNSTTHYLHEEDSPALIDYKLLLMFDEFSGISVACRNKVEAFVYCTNFINEVQFYLEEKVKDKLEKKL
jgi:hypothetical protein